LVDKKLVDDIVEVRCKSDRIMSIKLVVGVKILNVNCVYALQAGLVEDIKREFGKELEEVIENLPRNEKLFLGGDLNDHIRTKADGYDRTRGGFSHG